VARIQCQLAENEAQLVMGADLVHVGDAHHLGLLLILAVVPVGEEEGDGRTAGLFFKLLNDFPVVVLKPSVELLGQLVSPLVFQPLGIGEEGALAAGRARLDKIEAAF